MQMVKKIILGIFFAWFALVIFMPKTELYYALEKKLEKEEIKLNEQSINEGLFSLNVNDVDIYFKGVKVATIQNLSFFTVLFYTHIEVKKLIFDKLLQNKVPKMAEKADIAYNILSPLTINIDANGTFGIVKGEVSLSSYKIHLNFIEVGKIDTIQPFLKKDAKVWFYEKSF